MQNLEKGIIWGREVDEGVRVMRPSDPMCHCEMSV
jgi:hypothetical protein